MNRVRTPAQRAQQRIWDTISRERRRAQIVAVRACRRPGCDVLVQVTALYPGQTYCSRACVCQDAGRLMSQVERRARAAAGGRKSGDERRAQTIARDRAVVEQLMWGVLLRLEHPLLARERRAVVDVAVSAYQVGRERGYAQGLRARRVPAVGEGLRAARGAAGPIRHPALLRGCVSGQ